MHAIISYACLVSTATSPMLAFDSCHFSIYDQLGIKTITALSEIDPQFQPFHNKGAIWSFYSILVAKNIDPWI